MQLILKKRLAECLFDFPLPRVCSLPAVETHVPHDLIDIRDHLLDHDWRFAGFDALEELGQ